MPLADQVTIVDNQKNVFGSMEFRKLAFFVHGSRNCTPGPAPRQSVGTSPRTSGLKEKFCRCGMLQHAAYRWSLHVATARKKHPFRKRKHPFQRQPSRAGPVSVPPPSRIDSAQLVRPSRIAPRGLTRDQRMTGVGIDGWLPQDQGGTDTFSTFLAEPTPPKSLLGQNGNIFARRNPRGWGRNQVWPLGQPKANFVLYVSHRYIARGNPI